MGKSKSMVRTLSVRCRECTEVAYIECPRDTVAPKYRVVHGEDGHTLQIWVDAEPGVSAGTWDQQTWK